VRWDDVAYSEDVVERGRTIRRSLIGLERA
jgi:hypothetical protein